MRAKLDRRLSFHFTAEADRSVVVHQAYDQSLRDTCCYIDVVITVPVEEELISFPHVHISIAASGACNDDPLKGSCLPPSSNNCMTCPSSVVKLHSCVSNYITQARTLAMRNQPKLPSTSYRNSPRGEKHHSHNPSSAVSHT